MRESEIREQILTQAKNIKFMNEMINEIDSLPVNEANKRADEYYFYQNKLNNTNSLDDSITRRKLLHEMYKDIGNLKNDPNPYKELISVAIQELKSKDYIYWIDNRYSCKDNVSNKSIIEHLIANFYKKQIRFGGYISRSDFKKWVCDVFTEMHFSFSEDSIKKEIDFLL